MLVKAQGIVLRSIKYGESGLICEILTDQFGPATYIVQGVRSGKSQAKANLLSLMSIIEFVAYQRTDREINRLKEVQSAYIYNSLPFDFKKGAVGLFMTELSQKTIKGVEPGPSLYEFVRESFIFLDQTQYSFANIHLVYALKLAYHLGFLPGGDCCQETPLLDLQEGLFVEEEAASLHTLNTSQSKLMALIRDCSLENSHLLSIHRSERQNILLQIIDYFRLHLEHFKGLNSHLILQNVLESGRK